MMNAASFFSQSLLLENDRCMLSPLGIQHVGVLDTIAYQPAIWTMSMSNLTTPAHLQAYITVAVQERENHQSYPFIIFDKKTSRVAGSTRFSNILFAHKRLEIGGTWIHPDFQGSGLNKACKFLLLQYAFETLAFNRVEIKTDVLNLQSRKAILKLGASEEGVFRRHQITSEGRLRDSIYFSIIAEEWPGIKADIFKEFI